MMTHRPLPPLPTQNSLDRVHESDSEENDYSEDDSDENDEEGGDVERNDSGDADTERQRNKVKHNHHLNSLATNEKTDQDSMKLNGIETGSSGPQNPDNELRRRKRAERQANFEQKVNDIKRKQRKSEDHILSSEFLYQEEGHTIGNIE